MFTVDQLKVLAPLIKSVHEKLKRDGNYYGFLREDSIEHYKFNGYNNRIECLQRTGEQLIDLMSKDKLDIKDFESSITWYVTMLVKLKDHYAYEANPTWNMLAPGEFLPAEVYQLIETHDKYVSQSNDSLRRSLYQAILSCKLLESKLRKPSPNEAL